MVRCTIHLENNDCVYAGQMLKGILQHENSIFTADLDNLKMCRQIITGTIKIILKEPKKIRSKTFFSMLGCHFSYPCV